MTAPTLAGLRADFDVVESLRERLLTRNTLEDSSVYHVLLEEDRERGQREDEIKRGSKAPGLHGPAPSRKPSGSTRSTIEASGDLDRLEPVLAATSRDDLLAEMR
jgi:hypothetical protein